MKSREQFFALQREVQKLAEQRDEARAIANATLEALNETKRELAGAILVQELLIMREGTLHDGKYSIVLTDADFEVTRGFVLRVGSDPEKKEHHFIVEPKPDDNSESEGDMDAVPEGGDIADRGGVVGGVSEPAPDVVNA